MEAHFTKSYPLKEYEEKLRAILSTYTRKEILADGSVQETVIEDDYLLVNDIWKLDFFVNIPQFRERLTEYRENPVNHIFIITFNSVHPIINLELKCLYKLKIFNDEWTAYSSFQKHTHRYRVINFMQLFYPESSSLKELDIDKAEEQYIAWLRETGIEVTEEKKFRHGRPVEIRKVRTAAFLRSAYNSIMHYLDDRPLWVRDVWRLKDFQDSFDFEYHKSSPQGFVRFDSIENNELKQMAKDYIKDRLLGKRHMSWHSAQAYSRILSRFFNIISPTGTEKKAIRNLERKDILAFIEWTRCYYAENNRKGLENHLNRCMGVLQKFLEELQSLEHKEAPRKSIRQLINPGDFPKYTQHRQVNSIPDSVLEQLFSNLNYLHPEVIPIVWITFKTGLRISDVLTLTNKCLITVNESPYLQLDISKTKVHNHRIPIDTHIADIITFLAKRCELETNMDNNPKRYLFPRLSGTRKGRPFTQGFVREELNTLAIKQNIAGEDGEIYHFRMHEFRHTYAVKLLNNGADILTVQELLAHASPEMTMVYARYSDDNKRKEFEKVLASGTFEFSQNGLLQKIEPDQLNKENLDSLWQNHKLNAIDNPYGTCMARLNGKCPFINEPPCLSCNNGNPCKDLAIGLSDLDNEKYQLHIKTMTKTIELLKSNGRMDLVEKNEHLLEKYTDIERKITQGSIIYGRSNRTD
ncbi:TPA: tyrosine-type recombinase/integrase [Listeria monocytogenes]|nr:tyrosine-type recombinase/integrase [Listeria monocytogenes]HBI6186931.1 tyrosine-type recombinase/integrase [Listeria monocytogenes]HBI6229200.1 tyrosine-type recombinase/integrase [Listeria monocytogenes]HBI6770524.1 tyrosine-type recombinase/integrase [Listeria monocytogenes]HBI6829194.1 tyrosine-type recombinase/integrase [Listeria monocytogenes]